VNIQQLNKDLIALALPYTLRADQVQGPGGNISVKDDDGHMMIKASGYRFEEINATTGYSVVKYDVIKDYFHTVNIKDKQEEENTSVALVLENVLTHDGKLFPKPSMETGFHAVLGKYVIHTHSVWSNLLNCSMDSKELLKKIEDQSGISIAVIPYVSPGFGLSYLITEAIKQANNNNQKLPEVFFLMNHGIIAHGNSITQVQDVLKQVDEEIKKLYSVQHPYPSVEIKQIAAESFTGSDDYVNNIIKVYKAGPEFFDQVIFPDQTVFFKGNISAGSDTAKKIHITEDGKMIYNCGLREAKSIHETMTAYLFIYDTILQSGRKLRFIPETELDYINGMEMEKHRKSLM
jgi:ribulose-5-phosphate 4-epimerase/fuculose-1-phosphate aldolase